MTRLGICWGLKEMAVDFKGISDTAKAAASAAGTTPEGMTDEEWIYNVGYYETYGYWPKEYDMDKLWSEFGDELMTRKQSDPKKDLDAAFRDLERSLNTMFPNDSTAQRTAYDGSWFPEFSSATIAAYVFGFVSGGVFTWLVVLPNSL